MRSTCSRSGMLEDIRYFLRYRSLKTTTTTTRRLLSVFFFVIFFYFFLLILYVFCTWMALYAGLFFLYGFCVFFAVFFLGRKDCFLEPLDCEDAKTRFFVMGGVEVN
jgi:hypothetical protein